MALRPVIKLSRNDSTGCVQSVAPESLNSTFCCYNISKIEYLLCDKHNSKEEGREREWKLWWKCKLAGKHMKILLIVNC